MSWSGAPCQLRDGTASRSQFSFSGCCWVDGGPPGNRVCRPPPPRNRKNMGQKRGQAQHALQLPCFFFSPASAPPRFVAVSRQAEIHSAEFVLRRPLTKRWVNALHAPHLPSCAIGLKKKRSGANSKKWRRLSSGSLEIRNPMPSF